MRGDNQLHSVFISLLCVIDNLITSAKLTTSSTTQRRMMANRGYDVVVDVDAEVRNPSTYENFLNTNAVQFS